MKYLFKIPYYAVYAVFWLFLRFCKLGYELNGRKSLGWDKHYRYGPGDVPIEIKE